MTTPLVNWLAGNDITAANLNLMQNALSVIKSSDQDVTSSAVLVNDNALFLPMVANATYWFNCFLSYKGGTLGSSDLQFQWAGPASSSMRFGASYFAGGGGWDGIAGYMGYNITATTNGTSNVRPVIMTGSVQTSTTAGNLQLQWAQNTSDSTPTTVQAQSYLSLVRVS
jgi:hypothetical protein